jgi:adenosine deaminase
MTTSTNKGLGVFSTSISQEYQLAASLLDLTVLDLRRLACKAMAYAFVDESVQRQVLQQYFN